MKWILIGLGAIGALFALAYGGIIWAIKNLHQNLKRVRLSRSHKAMFRAVLMVKMTLFNSSTPCLLQLPLSARCVGARQRNLSLGTASGMAGPLALSACNRGRAAPSFWTTSSTAWA